MTRAGLFVACGLVAIALVVAAVPEDPRPSIRIHPGDGHAAAAQDGWIHAEFSGDSMVLEVRSAPGSVTEYGSVFSIMNHADVPVSFCLFGPPTQAAPFWTLHGDGLFWHSGQVGATLVTLAPGEERQVEVHLDWRDDTAQATPITWSIVPLGEPGCQI